METLTIISLLTNYLMFAFLGFNFSKKIIKPLSVFILLLIILITILAGWIKLARIIDIYNFRIQFNWCLQGFGLGFILGLLRTKFGKKIVTE
ncbi:MAG: hypothetical protein IPM56_00305 [Ignavibacteriales bacterium]|nr:MAG: hypothetical protein IPM56_00305 [Ignavibacteriales bacterium]